MIPLRIEQLPEVLSKPLDNEVGVLDALVVALAKGQHHAELWQRLHDAALRDDRTAELAFAYEKLQQDRRLKIMPPANQATVSLHVYEFFKECLSDLDGAIAALERVLAVVPNHPDAFARLVEIFERKKDRARLIQLYTTAASPKIEREQQLEYLQKALSLAAGFDDDRAVKLAQQILKLDPANVAALDTAEEKLSAASKFSDVTRMLEAALQLGIPDDAALRARGRLVELYDSKLAEIEKAVPHVEELLARDPSHAVALRAAQRLLAHKTMAPRAAAAMEKVYEAQGDTENVAKMLAIQVEQLRGPKKVEAQKRLAELQISLGDQASALTHLEAVVLGDLADEDAREKFLLLAMELDRAQDAARVLSRAAAGAKDAPLRGRINADLGHVYVVLGDAKRAKQVLVSVIDTSGDDAATLSAARTILPLYEDGKEAKQIAAALERIGALAPDAEEQATALLKLAVIAEQDLKDLDLAIQSLRRVMEVSPSVEARDHVERLLEATGRFSELAEVIESRARLVGDRPEAREMLLRAAKLREQGKEIPIAIDVLSYVVETFGPAHDVHALLIPLLMQQKRVPELLVTLAAEAEIVPPDERAPIYVRIARIRVKQGDRAEALEAYAKVLALTPDDADARQFVEAAMESPDGGVEGGADLRLRATEILLPIYDSTGNAVGLSVVCDVRATLATEPADRLAILEDGLAISSDLVPGDRRALGFAERGLREAIASNRDALPAWVQRVSDLGERLADAEGGAEAIARVWVDALGDHPIDDASMVLLGKATGRALAVSEDSKRALEVYRRVLEFVPDDAELLSIVDDLLEEQGSPADRVVLYEAALERHRDAAKRRELFHKIGAVQRRDLRDVQGAIATYRRALSEFPDDKAFRGALFAAYEVAEAWEDLYGALDAALASAPPEEQSGLERRLAEVSLSAQDRPRAGRHFGRVLALGGELSPAQLDVAEGLAKETGDADLLRAVLERRLAMADTPGGRATELERIGDLLVGRGASDEAADHFLRAARECEGLDDHARELALLDKVLAARPAHRPTLARRIDIARATGDDALLARGIEETLAASNDKDERVALALSLEEPLGHLGDVDRWVKSLDAVLEETGPRLDLLGAKARALTAAQPAEAGKVYRAMLSSLSDDDAAEAASAYEAFLASRGTDPNYFDDRRALFSFRAKGAAPDERRRILFASAIAERDAMGSPSRALAIVRELLAADPNDLPVLELETELARALGDHEAVARSIERRAGISEGEARRALLVELANVLMDDLGRADDALNAAEDLLQASPTDPAAHRILERALRNEAARGRAGEMLERLAGDLPEAERAAIYESLLVAEPSADEGSKPDPSRSGIYKKLLAVAEGNPERALGIALRAVGEFPEEEELWSRSEELARTLGAADRVSMAYRQVLAQAETKLTPESAMTIGQRGVDFQEEWFDDPDAVAHMLKLIVDVAPNATWAFERLKLLYNAGERWGDLFALYDRVIAGTEDEGLKVEILEDAASVAKDLAGDPDRAIGYFEQLHRLEPNDGRTVAALERLYEKHAKHKPLIDLLAERLADADVEERTELRLRMANLWLDGVRELDPARVLADEILKEAGESAKAEQLLERILGMTGGDARGLARLRRSMDARDTTQSEAPLSMKIASPAADAAKLPEIRKKTALSLKERYSKAGKHELTATMIDVALESASPGEERRALLDELIALERGGLGDRARALDTLSLVARLNPLDAALRTELETEAAALGANEKLVDVLIEIAERCPEPKDSLPILERASEIARTALGDSNRVISIDLRILARTDQDPARAKEAAEKLDGELKKSGREAERCGVLERLAELETDVAARGRVLHEVARIARDVIGDVERASRALRQRLTDEPDDLAALSLLIDNVREIGAREELAQRLERRVELLDVNDKRRADLLELARLHASLDDLRAATRTYERLLSEHGAEDEVADELAKVLAADGEVERLAGLLLTEATRATDPARKAHLYTELGAVQVRMNARPQAAAAYAKALDHAADLDVARVGLESLLDELAGNVELYRTMVASLDRAFKTTGAWERSLALVPARLQAAESNGDRATIHMEAADLEEQKARDPGLATTSTWKAFCIAPERDPIASELLRRARLSGRWDVIVPGLLEALEGRLVPVDVARDLLVDSSDFALREDPKPTRALELLEASLVRLPYDVDALKRLVEARRRAPSTELCDVLGELADALANRQQQPDATLASEALDCAREAVVVALRTLDDKDLALRLARKLFDESTRRWAEIVAGRVDEDPAPARDAASFAIDVLVELLVARGETTAVYDTLVRGAQLPFGTDARRSLLVRATEHATRADAILIYQALFDEDVTDVDVARELEARYLAEGRKADVVGIRRKQIGVAESVAERLGLRVSLASLFEEIADVDSAFRTLLENLAEVPTDEVSVGFLARLYEGAGKREELASLWEAQAKLWSSPSAAGRPAEAGRAVEMWERAAVLREALKDLPAAIQARKRIVDIVADVRSLNELARVLEASKKHLDAAGVIERLIAAAEAEGVLEESMVLRVASAYEHGGKRERALAWLEKYDGPTASADLRARLRASYRALSMLEPLAALLAREAESAPDPKTRMSRLKEAAAIFTTELHQPDRAIPLLSELLDLDKTDLVTRLLLSDALRAGDRFEEAGNILKQLLDEYGARRPKERALVHFELAKVAMSLKDSGMAMRELEAASKIDQSHPGILHALAKLALQEGQLLRAQRTFRALLLVVRPGRAAGRESFAATPLPEAVGKALDVPISRAEVLVELAAIAEKQGEADRKVEFVESAFEAAAENGWEAEQLTNALRSHGWSELVARAIAGRVETAVGAARVPLLLERAELLAGPLGKPSEALGGALEALRLDPSSPKAHELSLRLAQVAGEIRRYTDALSELATAAAENPALGLELSLFEARTKEREFADHAGAREAFERVLERLGDLVSQGSAPPNVSRLDVLEELLGVLEKLADKPAQIKTLGEIIELSLEAQRPLRQQADLYHALAKLQFSSGEIEAGVDALEQVVNTEPEPDRAEAALREGLVAAPNNLRVARLFEDFCRQHKRNEALVDALVAVADRDEDPRAPLREAYETSMSLGREDRAELLLLRIVQLGGDSEASAWALVALGERRLASGAVADACDLLERGAKVSPPDDERALLLRVASIAEETLRDPKRAVAVLEGLRSRDPADRDVWGPLARIHKATGDTAALSSLLTDTVPLVDDAEERSRLRMSLAEILLTSDSARAADLLKESLDEQPGDDRVAELLAGIYRKDGDTAGLVSLTERRLDAAKDREDRPRIVALSMELGRLHEAAGDDSAALEVFHAALDWDPQSRDALRAVVALGMKRDDSVGLGDELDRLLALEEGQAAIDLAIKVAQMKRAQGDELGAERALVAGLKAQPSNQAIREELVRAYTARGAKKELTDLDKLAALAIEDPLGRKASLLRLSEVYRDELGDAKESAECLDLARAADPGDRDLLFTLMDAFSNLGEHKRAINAVNEAIKADKSGDPSWYYFSRAVLEEAIGDSDAALADLEEAHEKSGRKYGSELRAHLEAALVRVAREPSSSTHSERILRLRLAELTAEQGDTAPARLLVSELLRRDAMDRDALRSLVRIEEMAGDTAAIAAALERLAPLEDDASKLTALALRLAEVATAVGRPASAKPALERAVQLSPGQEAPRAALKSIYLAMGDVMTLAEILIGEARGQADPERVHAGLLEAAELLLRDEVHAGTAIELLDEARPLKPGDLDADLLLADAYAMSGRLDESVALTESLIAGFKGRRSRELGRAFYALYKARNREGNLSDALAALSKAFENDPQNARMARELGELAVDLDDAEVAQRAFRSITLMKPGTSPNDGPSQQDKAQSYFHLGRIAVAQGDRRRAKLMLEKALTEEPNLAEARDLLDRID